MDKIVELSNLYGISTDYLLKDSIDQIPDDIILDFNQEKEVHELSLEEIDSLLSVKNNIRLRTALGVCCLISSMIPFLLLYGLTQGGFVFLSSTIVEIIGVSFFTIMVCAGILLFILNNTDLERLKVITRGSFNLAYGVKEELQKRRLNHLSKHYLMIGSGVILCIVGSIQFALIKKLYYNLAYYISFSMALALLCFSIALFIFIYSSQLIETYKKLIEEKASFFDDNNDNDCDSVYSKQTKHKARATRHAFWLFVIVFYFLIGFFTGQWNLTWIIFIAAAGIDKLLRAYL